FSRCRGRRSVRRARPRLLGADAAPAIDAGSGRFGAANGNPFHQQVAIFLDSRCRSRVEWHKRRQQTARLMGAGGNAMQLTQDQLAQFERDGYVFIPDLFSAEEIAVMKREVPALFAQDRPENVRERGSGK